MSAGGEIIEGLVKVVFRQGAKRIGKMVTGAIGKKLSKDEAKEALEKIAEQQLAKATRKAKGKVKKGPIQKNEVTTYQDFVNRSVVGDNLEGHEVLQHANLKANGLATERLSTEASKNNPVIAVEKKTHKEINKAQRALDAAKQTPEENIKANAEILRKAGIPENKIEDITSRALQHARNLQK